MKTALLPFSVSVLLLLHTGHDPSSQRSEVSIFIEDFGGIPAMNRIDFVKKNAAG
jgi:hypothetical protein